MENKVEETGTERLSRLRAEAKTLGIVGRYKADEFEKMIAQAKIDGQEKVVIEPISAGGLTPEEAGKIDARLKYEEDAREKFRVARQIQIDRATIIAESETHTVEIDLPEIPTELELARARAKLGIEKKEVKPSPETRAIEASKRGYYRFTNREQDDAAHTVNLGGKYTIHLIPNQIHVLSEYHVRKWDQIAVTPVYKRVPTGVVSGPDTVGELAEECRRVGGKPRFGFDYLGEAPQDAPFGLVTDTKILDEFKPKKGQTLEEQYV